MELAVAAGKWFEKALATPGISGIELVGPAPCPIERIKTRWRWHLLLRATNSAALTRVARHFLTSFDVPSRGELRVTFDRDPVSLL